MSTIRQVSLDQAIESGRCSRCNRRINKDPDANLTMKSGYLVGFICSRCQTPEENAEAVINEATVDYSSWTTNAFGQSVGRSKGWQE